MCVYMCAYACICVYVSRHLMFLLLQLYVQFMLTLLNPLNAELNPIRHLLALVGARHIVYISRIRVNSILYYGYKSQSCVHVLSKFSHLLIPSSCQYFPQKCVLKECGIPLFRQSNRTQFKIIQPSN